MLLLTFKEVIVAKEKQKRYYWILILGIILCIDFVFLLTLNAVTNLGTFLPGIAGVLAIIIFFYKRKTGRKLLSIRNNFVRIAIRLIFIIILASFLLIEGLIIFSLKEDKDVKTDIVIVLGAGLKGDQIPLTLRYRLDKCIEYANKYRDSKIIVTGGQGRGESITEAEAMAGYLIGHGIEPERILKEDRATSTQENFKYSGEIIKKTSLAGASPAVMVVTSDFHMFRAKFLASRNGLIPYSLPARTWLGILPNNMIREYFAIIKSLVFDY